MTPRLEENSAARLVAPFAPREPMAELHTHLGGSVPVHVLWEIAHAQGISLPVKDFWDFRELVQVGPAGVAGLEGLDAVYHWCEQIQSSPAAVERAVHTAIGGGYRTQHITTVELRFNPAKRNRNGEWDLDHVILAACRALDRASLEYSQVRAGLVLMMDRSFDRSLNEVVVEKALRWADRGIVGIDLGGPRPSPGRWPYRDLADAVAAARRAGLGVTIHCGEEGDPDEIGEVVECLQPNRIGHGVLAATNPQLVALLARTQTVAELCPTSNLRTGVFPDLPQLADAVRTLLAGGVPLTVSTDGPVMMGTSLREEHALLVSCGALTVEESRQANAVAHAATFCPTASR